ncbi:hypothetical protein V2J09_020128 [Rumex salicifolius]
MAEDLSAPPMRLVNFVSQDELDLAKKTRGERVEDGTAQRDRPLFEILKENKDKHDAEFNERFKHRPPKALDEDETEFLDNLEMSQKQYERQIADQEESELQKFQAAVAAQAMTTVYEIKETTPSNVEELKPRVIGKKAPNNPLGMVIKVKPQAKKAKLDQSSPANPKVDSEHKQTSNMAKSATKDDKPKSALPIISKIDDSRDAAKTCLVSYSDESDED